ncbi:MAG: hypothetical protein A3F85_04010 [Candidatus Ryanbacteria bacterium RIFCSPLOWO2_12_FULL_44_26]|nr:MAG: hypothetical protein A2718_00750 [Candidatus Ryanbacteria bacterium RIFCSPHIGHO2_01_FULL_44_130]OGZ55763.1 MAG: hypothetical protein A3F85_04010 [Candidatus Ryanbacteria bacterium RIFCSPLOWO2_12_FULL_44_26]
MGGEKTQLKGDDKMKKERLNFNERMKFSNIFWVLCILLFASGVPVTAIGLSMSKLSFVVSGAGIVIIGFVSFYISLKLEDEARHGDRDHPLFFEKWMAKK